MRVQGRIGAHALPCAFVRLAGNWHVLGQLFRETGNETAVFYGGKDVTRTSRTTQPALRCVDTAGCRKSSRSYNQQY